MTDCCLSSGWRKLNCWSSLLTQKTTASTMIAHLRTPKVAPSALLIQPRLMALSNLESSLPAMLSASAMPKKSRAYATASQTGCGQVNCSSSQAEKTLPQIFAPMKPRITAAMAMTSVIKPLIVPLTRPMRSGSNMTISSHVMD